MPIDAETIAPLSPDERATVVALIDARGELRAAGALCIDRGALLRLLAGRAVRRATIACVRAQLGAFARLGREVAADRDARPCPSCGAKIGEWCKAEGGRATIHAERRIETPKDGNQ